MKLLIGLIFLSNAVMGTCSAQEDVDIAKELFSIIVENDSSNIEGLLKLVVISDSLLNANDGEIIDVIKFYSFLFSEELRETCDNTYDIYHHDEIDQALLSKYKLKYADLDKVYYLVCGGDIFTYIIIDKGKVISFFPYLIRGGTGNVVSPIILN